MGQYGHNNQPSHHILYLFAMLGEQEITQRTIRTVMDRAYGSDFYAGDEDNGEMGAWFVLSALGLFAAAPGTSDSYVLGSPLFKHVAIQRHKDSSKVSHLEDIVKEITSSVMNGETKLKKVSILFLLCVIKLLKEFAFLRKVMSTHWTS